MHFFMNAYTQQSITTISIWHLFLNLLSIVTALHLNINRSAEKHNPPMTRISLTEDTDKWLIWKCHELEPVPVQIVIPELFCFSPGPSSAENS